MHGGAEVVGAWMLQALRAEHELTVLAWEQLHLADLNHIAGTSLSPRDYALITPPRGIKAAGDLAGRLRLDPHRTQIFAWLMRMAGALRDRFDLVISPYGEADLGGRGLQYVHEPWIHPFMAADVGRRPWMRLAGFDSARVRANVTLANSVFTASEVTRLTGMPARVVHPPVPGDFEPLPWQEREDTVLVVGRLVPEKRIEDAVAVVRRLRVAGRPLTLSVVGRVDPNSRSYAARLRAALPSWATLHTNLPRTELLALAGRARWGLHGFRGEPFGIAVAELVASGCVVLARRGGGVGEIVAADALLFDDVDEATARLGELYDDEARCERVRSHLARRAQAFGTERFERAIRAEVALAASR